MIRGILAHVLALLLTPIAATASVLFLAQLAGRLTRWRSASGGSEFMFSMPIGGMGWQISSTLLRAFTAFGAARLVFWIFRAPPTVYAAAAITVMFCTWDVFRVRLATRPPMRPPVQAVQVLRFKIIAGLVAAVAAGILFVRS